jgi:hypothetical protein
MSKSIYSASFTAGSLLHKETTALLPLLLSGDAENLIKEEIKQNNVLKYIQNLGNRITDLELKSVSLSRDEQRLLEKLKTDLIECKEYDLLLKDVADQQITFDPDDGVVVNYQKFATVVVPIK